MAISSLSRFTVPLASDQSANSQGLLMPKLKYRFRLSLENFGAGSPVVELTKQVIDVTRPNVNFESIALDVYNSKIYYAGKHTWQPITITIRDDVNNSVNKLCGEQLQKQFDFFEQSSAASGIDYKFKGRIEILDGGNGANAPGVLETFELVGCFIQDINYNQLSYSDSNPVDIQLQIQYDNAIQTNGAGQPDGLGQAVGRTIRTLATG
jgi:hypothetical protein|tara:strand:- start:1698 stop:2324 length:627 start_codon:yes stop_codon:yes gene_type:complete